jgi:hypothetical protein
MICLHYASLDITYNDYNMQKRGQNYMILELFYSSKSDRLYYMGFASIDKMVKNEGITMANL